MEIFIMKKRNTKNTAYWTKVKVINVIILCFLVSCQPQNQAPVVVSDMEVEKRFQPVFYNVDRDIPIREYFEFLDAMVAHLDTALSYPINEYLIAHANPWLIDSLVHTDYYYLKEKGIFNEDPKALPALRKGDQLLIPDSLMADSLRKNLDHTLIDVNIPEFTLRIIENDKVLYAFPVRVGRVAKKYLAMAGRKIDLRTKTGTGQIIRVNRNPVFINPSNNKRYYKTRRDDGNLTKLPRTPWIEPELDGQRYGQLIHPTTNPETLGKAYSNGCLGMREGDMWRVYYHAPVGTPIQVRYSLQVIDEKGDTTFLKNIYPGFEQKERRRKIIAATRPSTPDTEVHSPICDCGVIAE
jgi:L,D-transpeptidase ErfK/SrfK